MIASLLLAGGLTAVQAAMIAGAILFSLMMILMGLSLLKALFKDSLIDKENTH